MDLNEWEKMSQEEQQAYMEGKPPKKEEAEMFELSGDAGKIRFVGTADELSATPIKVLPSRVVGYKVPTPEEIAQKTVDALIDARTRCCEVNKWLKKQIEDEVKASEDYEKAADTLGTPSVAGGWPALVLERMAADERSHEVFLRAITESLDLNCHCEGD